MLAIKIKIMEKDGSNLPGCILLYTLYQTLFDGYILKASDLSLRKLSKFSMSNLLSILPIEHFLSSKYAYVILQLVYSIETLATFFGLGFSYNFLLTKISSNKALALVYCDRLVLSPISNNWPISR